MADKNQNYSSLVQHFDAPIDYRATFGWVCGYSADAAFMNEAVERFTRETEGQRAHRGRFALALLLDPGHPGIAPADVPGVAHLPIRHLSERPFKLLHAKVAMLGFQHDSGDGRWLVRLIVSTGNWTRQTIEESLDLVWCCEVGSDELNSDTEDLRLRCADVKAASTMFGDVRRCFDLRVLDANTSQTHGETALAKGRLDGWIKLCQMHAGSVARFVDNRHQSLISQLSPKLKAVAGDTRRNYLAMGSGFFESSLSPMPGHVPDVLDAIVTQLRSESLLGQKGTIDVFINPLACQAVATSIQAIRAKDWNVRPAAQMEQLFGVNSRRFLHAKFIFSHYELNGSNRCNSAWMYLGSGNLTGPGFASAMSQNRGNLEAGVIFPVQDMVWEAYRNTAPSTLITNRLPIQWDIQFDDATPLLPGSDMPEHSEFFVAAPIAWLSWTAANTGGHLQTPEGQTAAVEVLDRTGNSCSRDSEGFRWPEDRPRQARVRWDDSGQPRECLIPVLDEFGRLAATELPELNFEDAWSSLLGFPETPRGDDGTDVDGDSSPAIANEGPVKRVSSSYPIRQMMELIENIAAKQTAISTYDWPAWCARLEQTLTQISDNTVLAYFHTLCLDPLSPLKAAPFRPAFAESPDSEQGAMYEAVLARIGARWKTTELANIDGGVR